MPLRRPTPIGESAQTCARAIASALLKVLPLVLLLPSGPTLAQPKLYFTDPVKRDIERTGLTTTEVLLGGLSEPRGIALDVTAGKMYWIDSGTDKIQRADLDGSNVGDVVTSGLVAPRGLALVSALTADPIVTTATDEQDGSCNDGSCSLRDAVAVATGGSTITFAPGLSAGSTSTLSLGQITLSQNVTIDGTALDDGFTLDADGSSRVFDVTGGGTATLRGLTLTCGDGDQGGGVLNAGTLTLDRVTVRGNTAGSFGSGLCNTGTLTPVNTTVSGNTAASSFGGGVRSHSRERKRSRWA